MSLLGQAQNQRKGQELSEGQREKDDDSGRWVTGRRVGWRAFAWPRSNARPFIYSFDYCKLENKQTNKPKPQFRVYAVSAQGEALLFKNTKSWRYRYLFKESQTHCGAPRGGVVRGEKLGIASVRIRFVPWKSVEKNDSRKSQFYWWKNFGVWRMGYHLEGEIVPTVLWSAPRVKSLMVPDLLLMTPVKKGCCTFSRALHRTADFAHPSVNGVSRAHDMNEAHYKEAAKKQPGGIRWKKKLEEWVCFWAKWNVSHESSKLYFS